MIYLIGGENTYESRIALEKLLAAVKSTSIMRAYVSEQNSFQKALAGLDNFGLFASNEKKVILLLGFDEALKADEEKVLSIAGNLLNDKSNQTDIVIHSRANWDKRGKFYKFFNEASKANKTAVSVQEFKLLSGKELDHWLNDYVKNVGLSIERTLLQQLIFRVGNNQNILVSEIEKLCLLQNAGTEITTEVFQNIVVDTQNVDIWDLIDVLTSNKSKAFRILDYLSTDFEYEYIMGLFARQIRLLFLALSAGSREGLQSFGVHPFVAGKLISESKHFTLEKIKKLYEKMVSIDINVKSGKLDKGLALDLLLIAF